MLEQLLYKAFMELSANRADFLSRLFARKRPADLPANATIDTMFAAFDNAVPSEELFRENLQAAKDKLVKDHKFTLSEDDLKGLEYVYSAFFRGGPDLNYAFSPTGIGGFGGGFPSYRELMNETDGQGEQRSYLATEENFRVAARVSAEQRDRAGRRRFRRRQGAARGRRLRPAAQRHGDGVLHVERRAVPVPGSLRLEEVSAERRDLPDRLEEHVHPVDLESRLSVLAVPAHFAGRARVDRALPDRRTGQGVQRRPDSPYEDVVAMSK